MVTEYDISNILPRLIGSLKEIYDQEIQNGNTVVEIAGGWPMKRVNIWFAKPISSKYKKQFPDLIYKYLGDPKGDLEYYMDKLNEAFIAAKFS